MLAPGTPRRRRARDRQGGCGTIARVTIDGARFLRHDLTWKALLAAVLTAWTVHYTSMTLRIHHGLGSSAYDVGLYDQGIWLMSRFKAPFVTLMGRNLMGDHTSFILVLLVPVYWLFPSIGALYFAQSLAIAAGAIPVYLYARRRLGTPAGAFVCAMAYLMHPAVAFTNLENFHPDAFLGVLVGFAVYGALERKWRLYAVFVFLSLMVKEDVALVIVPLGVWVALRRDRRKGLLTILAAVGFMLFAMFVVVRSLLGVATRNMWRIPFGGPRQFLGKIVTRPGEVASYLRSDGRPFYLWQMTAPFAWVFARLPDVAAISALVLFTNIMSTFVYQYSIVYHYSLIAVPALALGTAYAIGAMAARWRPLALGLVATATVLTSWMWGALPWSRFQYLYWQPDNVYAVELRRIERDIPSNASVSAYHAAAPHLSHRVEIYQFPAPFRAVLYGIDMYATDTRIDDRAEGVDYVLLPAQLDPTLQQYWTEIAPAFFEVERTSAWVLYERDEAVPLPPLVATATPTLPGG